MSQENPFKIFKEIYLETNLKEYLNILNQKDLELFLQERWKFLNSKKRMIHLRCYNSKNSWPFHTSIIEINLKDKPFIVDTVVDYLKSEGNRIFLLNNIILKIQRNKKGNIIHIEKVLENSKENESYIYIEIEKLEDQKLQQIQKQLIFNLNELEEITQSFPKTIQNLKQIKFENIFLEQDKNWLLENFIFMGYCEFQENIIKNPLGILKNQNYIDIIEKEIKSLIHQNSKQKETLLFFESKIKSNVKRHKPLHLIFLKKDTQNSIVIGSFAGKGELTPRYLIPFLKRNLDSLSSTMNAPLYGFRYKEIFKISQLIPLGILFTRKLETIKEWLSFFINNLYTSEQKILFSIDEDYEGIWVLIIELQKLAQNLKIKEFLKENSIYIETYFKRNYNQFQYSFLFLKSQKLSTREILKFLERNKEIFYSWYDRFYQILSNQANTKNIKDKIEFYFNIIPDSYPNYVTPKEGLKNLQFLETITKEKKFYVQFGKSISPNDKETNTLNIFSCYSFPLTDIFPVFQSVGIQISSEISFELNFKDSIKYLNIFYIENSIDNLEKNFLKKLEKGIEEILNGKYTIEKTNQLLWKSSLNIREINFIKTVFSYYYQLYKQYSRIFLQEFIVQNYPFAELIIEYIKKIFDPTQIKSEKLRIELLSKIEKYIYQLKTISEQTIALHIKEILENIVRTNYFLNLEEIAIKVYTKNLSFIPEPKPLFEIFVYSKDLEGIHIRSDYIARGGIRWSDRIDDYRIEIYELMKTQMVKNTLIIPNGAKGGFLIKKDIRQLDKKEIFKISQMYYKRFIYNLLSITDNIIKDKKIIHPKNIVILDKKDPYLVVAADKGTSEFSDFANEISEENQFWLKDAFASGGSLGYNHKKQGITAKGAWESVKRHFLEIGIDPEKDKITVIGIGDMSGDVFGNGMILSKSIQLIAAFNHIHIFIDPDPDPEISYQERLKLFKEKKDWNFYDKEKLSQGGGIFERNSPNIKLSKEIQERFEIKEEILNGEKLIQYILKAKADLLWNGGIGTYIKSSSESNKDVQDPQNDNVRVNANELKVKVIAEGGNLGITYKGRIEASKNGIKLNTDFIDNSGGVDMSDHEVNLKILLNQLVERKKISYHKRNQIIQDLEQKMIEKVLENNDFNNLGIAIENYRLKNYRFLISEWINFLKKERIIPEKEFTNSEDLTNPEICYLICYTKLYFKNYLYKLEKKFTSEIENYILKKYFPEELYKKYQKEIQNHPLRSEIVKVNLLNFFINSHGSLHLFIFHILTNKSYWELLEEWIEFLILSEIDFYQIYKRFSSLPKGFLYEELLKISFVISLIHILINKKNKGLIKNKKRFINSFNIIFKILQKKENLKTPIENPDFQEIDLIINSLEKTIIYYFLSIKISPEEFINSFYESDLEKAFNTIYNFSINNLQELKFQFRILNLYFSSLKNLISEEPKVIKDKLNFYLNKEKELKLIDLFEMVMEL